MLRLIIKGIGTKSFSKQIEPQKKPPKAMEKLKIVKNEAMEKERVNRLYLEFHAIPTDPLTIIQQRFIRKKRHLSNRRIYIPNVRPSLSRKDNTCCS